MANCWKFSPPLNCSVIRAETCPKYGAGLFNFAGMFFLITPSETTAYPTSNMKIYDHLCTLDQEVPFS